MDSNYSRVILLLALFFTLSCAFKITRVDRNTYLDSNVVRHEDTYSISADKDLTNFEVSFDFPDNLAYVEASLVLKDGDDEIKTKLTTTEVRKETANGERFAVFDVKFPKQVKGNSLTVEVKSYYTHAQTPYPAKIPQSGVQRVLYFGNHYIPSPYVIESQTTTLHANRFEDSTPLQPSNTGASQINYGPYSKVAPFSFSSNRVHAINNTPFLYVPKLIKDVEVSHWGNIAVEEKFEVKHEGAELKGTFSRVDYMHGSAGNSAREFVQILPKGAADVYYRDQIGNISSSHVRVEGDGSVRFEIEPRFVLFGGWKIDFYTGYNLPISSYLTNDGDNYSLTIPFHNIFEGTSVDEIEYRFTLPEGSSGIKVSSTSTITKRTEDKKFTYLDVSGRPVISFRAKNIISEHKDQVIIVNYTFSSSEIFKEPLLLVAGYFAFFLLTIFFFRFELNISK